MTESRSLIFVLTLLLLTSAGMLGILDLSVKGQATGLVCLAPANAPSCPAPPVTIGGVIGTQMSVAVLIQGSDGINGFDITLIADHNIVKPADAIAGTTSLLYGGSALVKCIGGVLKSGSVCSQTDTVDTIHFAYTGPFGYLTRSPTNGLLFTAVFNVTGAANTSIGYQTGCSLSSVTSTTVCVLFSNGSIGIPSETVQSATYTQAPSPTFTVQADQAFIALNKGSSTVSAITVASLNGYAGTLVLSVTVSPTVNHPIVTSFNPTTVTLVSGGSGSTVLTIQAKNNATRGNYVLTVTASDGHLSDSFQLQVEVVPG